MLIEVLRQSFQDVLVGVMNTVPTLLFAIIVVIIGWVLGSALSKVIEQLLKSLKLDKALSTAGLDVLVEKAGCKLNSGKFIGELLKWFVFNIPIIIYY